MIVGVLGVPVGEGRDEKTVPNRDGKPDKSTVGFHNIERGKERRKESQDDGKSRTKHRRRDLQSNLIVVQRGNRQSSETSPGGKESDVTHSQQASRARGSSPGGEKKIDE